MLRHDYGQRRTNSAVFSDLDVGQPLGAVDADEAGVFVDFATTQRATARYAQCRHASAAAGRAAEHLEGHITDGVGDVGQFKRDAQVGLVGTEAAHGFGVAHARKGRRQFDIEGFAEHAAEHLFDQRSDFLLAHERGLDIDLGEFGLAVGAQVFVAEAFDDLIVAVEARHHQQLLEELWRLRQGKELPGMHARRHEVVARAFRRALGQHRCFDVNEAVGIEKAAEGHRDLIAQTQVLLHLRTTQVDDTVSEAYRFRQVLVIELEGRRDGGVEDFDVVTQHFDLTGAQRGVFGSCRATAHFAGQLQHEFVAHRLGLGEHFGAIGVAHHLHEAVTVAQVDEDHATVVAAAVHPAAKLNSLVEVGGRHLAAVMAAHGKSGKLCCEIGANVVRDADLSLDGRRSHPRSRWRAH